MTRPHLTNTRHIIQNTMTRDTGSRAFLAGTLFVAVALFSAIAVAQTGLIQPTEEDTESRAVLDSETASPDSNETSEEATITINFREADILEVLEAYSNLLDINVVPGEGVSGVVTVISPGPVTRRQAINLLHSILKHRGFAVIENDGYISVVQDAIAELSGFPLYRPDMPDDQVAMLAVRPKYIDEETLAETFAAMGLMRPVSTNRDAGVLVITAAASKLKGIAELIEQLDVPQRQVITRTYPLQYATAEKIGPVIAGFIAQLSGQDSPGDSEDSITSGSVMIEERTNSLIVIAEEKYHKQTRAMLAELDKRSPQILLEAKVVEITLDRNNQMGLQWQKILSVLPMSVLTFSEAGATGVTNVLKTAKESLGGKEGINYALLDPKNHAVMVNLLATDSDARVLASPHLMASNNREAELRIGDEIPVLKETRMDTNNNPISTFDREKVGLELKLKPTIASNRDVSLDLEISNSNVIAGTTGDNQHTITERLVKTHVIIKDKHTLVISGLIREDLSGGTSGIPELKDLPHVGPAFGSQRKKKKSTELLVLITPYVILSESEAVRIGTDQLLKHPGAATAGALDHIEFEFDL
ncbi:MAG: secretin N-terminal domain-containing protein [Arenicellales bacterium]|jgi:general secretion pathway protein D|nr:secretin N-terminal domain-containing protein [Arenicellales bacterium]